MVAYFNQFRTFTFELRRKQFCYFAGNQIDGCVDNHLNPDELEMRFPVTYRELSPGNN